MVIHGIDTTLSFKNLLLKYKYKNICKSHPQLEERSFAGCTHVTNFRIIKELSITHPSSLNLHLLPRTHLEVTFLLTSNRIDSFCSFLNILQVEFHRGCLLCFWSPSSVSRCEIHLVECSCGLFTFAAVSYATV